MFQILEKKISGKISAIKVGTITPTESGIGKLFAELKKIDEPLHETLMTKYKAVLGERK